MVPPKDFVGSTAPAEYTLEIEPKSRFELIDVNRLIAESDGSFDAFRKAVYCSYHTTAGYLDQNICDRLRHDPESVETYVETFRKLFPADADYRHDQMDLRDELSESQRLVEPRNADSHLTYIGSGLGNVVTYDNRPDQPVYFVELDGVSDEQRRKRRTTIIGYNRSSKELSTTLDIPVSAHPMDSINLRSPELGLYDQLNETVGSLGITRGRIDISLHHSEHNAGLTVNEYETLLMRDDLMEVLRNPMRFMAEKGYHMLRDPRAIPEKAKNYAKYDLVRAVNKFIDKTGLNESVVERVLDKFLSVPASRFLRMKRGVSLLVSDSAQSGTGQILQGTYQSPILVQWRKSEAQARTLSVTFVRFE
jgi:thiamine phosphate synthase YjbQ (UPF0047 family)